MKSLEYVYFLIHHHPKRKKKYLLKFILNSNFTTAGDVDAGIVGWVAGGGL
jgi:hypothetical protein